MVRQAVSRAIGGWREEGRGSSGCIAEGDRTEIVDVKHLGFLWG